MASFGWQKWVDNLEKIGTDESLKFIHKRERHTDRYR